MRTRDEPYLGGSSCCALGAFTPNKCPKEYEKWCRGCNLVFCGEHIDPVVHNCREKPSGIFPLTKEMPLPQEKLVLTKKALVNGGVIWLVRRTIGDVGAKVERSQGDGEKLQRLNNLLRDLEQVAYKESKGQKTPRKEVNRLHQEAKDLLIPKSEPGEGKQGAIWPTTS
jgi:hypothetical protein